MMSQSAAYYVFERLANKVAALKDLMAKPEDVHLMMWDDLNYVRTLAQQDPTLYNNWLYGKELKALEQTHSNGSAPFCPDKWETSFAVGFLYYIYH